MVKIFVQHNALRYRMDGGVADTQPFFVKVTFAVFGGWGSDPCSPPACGGPPRDASAAGQSVFRVWPIGARSPVRVCRFTELTFLTLRKSMVFTIMVTARQKCRSSLLIARPAAPPRAASPSKDSSGSAAPAGAACSSSSSWSASGASTPSHIPGSCCSSRVSLCSAGWRKPLCCGEFHSQ